MSADNWEVCPRCLREAQVQVNRERVEAQSLYGQVPRDEYEIAIAALPERLPDPEDFRTLREDYEFCGASEGEIQANYSGVCSKCGLSVELKASKRFWSPEA